MTSALPSEPIASKLPTDHDWTPRDLVKHLLDMVNAHSAQEDYPPFIVLMAPSWEPYLALRYMTGHAVGEPVDSGHNLRQRILESSLFSAVRISADLAGFEIVLRGWTQGDKVVVKGLDLAFVFDCYMESGLARLLIEGESDRTAHYVVHARPEVLLPNDRETLIAEGWLDS
jgi:hypothetical protein